MCWTSSIAFFFLPNYIFNIQFITLKSAFRLIDFLCLSTLLHASPAAGYQQSHSRTSPNDMPKKTGRMAGKLLWPKGCLGKLQAVWMQPISLPGIPWFKGWRWQMAFHCSVRNLWQNTSLMLTWSSYWIAAWTQIKADKVDSFSSKLWK